jgi:hypothetical protein
MTISAVSRIVVALCGAVGCAVRNAFEMYILEVW